MQTGLDGVADACYALLIMPRFGERWRSLYKRNWPVPAKDDIFYRECITKPAVFYASPICDATFFSPTYQLKQTGVPGIMQRVLFW